MARYEERLQHDTDQISGLVLEVGALVERALDDAVRALLTVDRALASQTILQDLAINRATRRLDVLCHAYVARHLPSAGHLRFISAVLRISVALERIGDYAVTICREAVQISTEPPVTVARDIEMMADQARRLFRQAIKAFKEGSPDLARGARDMAAQLARTFDKIFDDLIHEGEAGSRPVRDLFALLVVFNRLERVSDQSKNICERIVFAKTGETKEPKRYRVLFLDERNDGLSQLAELLTRKAFPNTTDAASAGWEPAEELDPVYRDFMDAHGFELGDVRPRRLDAIHDELIDYHVIVDLGGEARQRLPEVPFHSIMLAWDLSDVGTDGEGETRLEALHGELSSRVGDLTQMLRGEDAD